MLSSSVEHLSARLYSSSIFTSGSNDSYWKKGVVGPKLLRKFWRTIFILYSSICWTTYPNLLMKSRIDSSSCLKRVCNELMFPFCWTEHKYWETNAAHNSLNKLMDPLRSLWNQAKVSPYRLARNTLHKRRSFPVFKIIAWFKCGMWSYGSEEPSYMENIGIAKPLGGS